MLRLLLDRLRRAPCKLPRLARRPPHSFGITGGPSGALVARFLAPCSCWQHRQLSPLVSHRLGVRRTQGGWSTEAITSRIGAEGTAPWNKSWPTAATRLIVAVTAGRLTRLG